MKQVTLEQARADLCHLVEQALAGEEVILLDDDRPIARLVPAEKTLQRRARRGSGKGEILYMAPDFDAELEDFKEYVPK